MFSLSDGDNPDGYIVKFKMYQYNSGLGDNGIRFCEKFFTEKPHAVEFLITLKNILAALSVNDYDSYENEHHQLINENLSYDGFLSSIEGLYATWLRKDVKIEPN